MTSNKTKKKTKIDKTTITLLSIKKQNQFISTRQCGVLDTNVWRTPHERVEILTRACGGKLILS